MIWYSRVGSVVPPFPLLVVQSPFPLLVHNSHSHTLLWWWASTTPLAVSVQMFIHGVELQQFSLLVLETISSTSPLPIGVGCNNGGLATPVTTLQGCLGVFLLGSSCLHLLCFARSLGLGSLVLRWCLALFFLTMVWAILALPHALHTTGFLGFTSPRSLSCKSFRHGSRLHCLTEAGGLHRLGNVGFYVVYCRSLWDGDYSPTFAIVFVEHE